MDEISCSSHQYGQRFSSGWLSMEELKLLMQARALEQQHAGGYSYACAL
jgi:hypothetical protein